MKYIILLLIFTAFICSHANSQSLNKIMNDKSKSYKDVIKELKKNDKYLKKASNKELKQYDRWRWFWDSRVDSSGSCTT